MILFRPLFFSPFPVWVKNEVKESKSAVSLIVRHNEAMNRHGSRSQGDSKKYLKSVREGQLCRQREGRIIDNHADKPPGGTEMENIILSFNVIAPLFLPDGDRLRDS